jgi:hypothetical protein
MKKFLALSLTLVLAIATLAGTINPPIGWAGQMWASTFALYGTKGTQTHFLCTAEPIEKIPGGYRLLTAGHCVQRSPEGLQFSVSEEIGGDRTPVTMVKAFLDNTLDFAIFDLQTPKSYTVFPLGNETELQIGDETLNSNFALGVGKQLSRGVVASDLIVASEECEVDTACIGKFIVQETAGAGASGSAILSIKTHQVVGLLVWEFADGQIGFGIEPISLFSKFMAGPDQPHPGAKEVSEKIPDEVFATKFGPKHAFKLTVHGPDPVFVQAGYKFQVKTDGFELSEKYYYKSKVFIGQDEDGYRIVSTKGPGFSLAVDVLGKE